MPKERRIYLANSALKDENYDAFRTIEEASVNGFYGVQLYINKDCYQPDYTDFLISSLKQHNLALIIHLKNEPEEPDIKVAEKLIKRTKETLTLVHYLPNLPLIEMPQIRDRKGERVKVGWENSVNEPDIDHVEDVLQKVKQDNTFFVFDYGRLMNSNNLDVIEKVRVCINQTFAILRPKRDVVHIADKMYWNQRFRDCPCVLGQGVVSEFLNQVKHFVNLGGRLVFEQEDLQMAINSLKVFQ